MGTEQASDADSVGYYGGNPLNTWYWFVFFYNNEYATTTPDVVHYDVKIDYYTKLERRVELNES